MESFDAGIFAERSNTIIVTRDMCEVTKRCKELHGIASPVKTRSVGMEAVVLFPALFS